MAYIVILIIISQIISVLILGVMLIIISEIIEKLHQIIINILK